MQSQFLPVRVMAVTTVVIVGVINLILTWIVLLVKVSTTLPLWVTKVIAGSNPVLLAYFSLPKTRSLAFHKPFSLVLK
jgi:hypothetical protein